MVWSVAVYLRNVTAKLQSQYGIEHLNLNLPSSTCRLQILSFNLREKEWNAKGEKRKYVFNVSVSDGNFVRLVYNKFESTIFHTDIGILFHL